MKHIVYIHGLNCSSKIFNYLSEQLPKHKATYIEYNSSQPIDESFQTMIEEFPYDEPASIIGHSLGGIFGLLIAARLKEHVSVESLVSISTPFGGSSVASKLRWFYPGFKVLKDIAPGSSIMKEVEGAKPRCPFLSIVSIGGHLPFIADENDGVVTIKSQRAIKCTKRVDVMANHFEAVQDPKTVEEIRKFVFRSSK